MSGKSPSVKWLCCRRCFGVGSEGNGSHARDRHTYNYIIKYYLTEFTNVQIIIELVMERVCAYL